MNEASHPIRIVIADDHAIIREGLISQLSREKHILVVGQAGDGQKVLSLVQELSPDIVLLDINMPVIDGLEVTKTICKSFPKTKVIALTMHEEKEYVLQIIRSGAQGYVVKSGPPSDLLQAIESVHAGNAFFSPEVSSVLLQEAKQPSEKKPELTAREREVLTLLAQDLSNKQVADKLNISIRTVETHREQIMRKLNSKSIVSLIRHALSEGLIKLD